MKFLRRFVANSTRYPLHHHLRIQRVCPKKRPNEDKCPEFDECCQLSAASPRRKKSHSGKLLTDYSLFGLRFVSTHAQKLGTVLYMGIMFYITHVLLWQNYQLLCLTITLKRLIFEIQICKSMTTKYVLPRTAHSSPQNIKPFVIGGPKLKMICNYTIINGCFKLLKPNSLFISTDQDIQDRA